MTDFAHCFLLVFGQLAAGGFFALSRLPFHDIERGFYKSTAAVYLASGAVIVVGQVALLDRKAGVSAGATVEVVLWMAMLAAGAVYLGSLWGEPYRRRAIAYAATVSFAFLAVVTSALRYSPAPPFSVESLLYPLSFLVSALMLGATVTGMLLGHWYLIDVGMPLGPLIRIWQLYRTSLLVQLGTLATCLLALSLMGAAPTTTALQSLWGPYQSLFWARLAVGPFAALGIAWMIWRTLAIPQTMAATGLFYVAILSTVVGEFLGRFLLFRTSLPL